MKFEKCNILLYSIIWFYFFSLVLGRIIDRIRAWNSSPNVKACASAMYVCAQRYSYMYTYTYRACTYIHTYTYIYMHTRVAAAVPGIVVWYNWTGSTNRTKNMKPARIVVRFILDWLVVFNRAYTLSPVADRECGATRIHLLKRNIQRDGVQGAYASGTERLRKPADSSRGLSLTRPRTG